MMATSMSFYASAASQEPCESNNAEKVCTNKKECKKEGKKEGKKAGKKDSNRRSAQRFGNPFEGLDLTAEQQNQINELQKTLRPEKKDKMKKEGLSDEQKKELRKEMKANQENIREKYLEGVKNILTPEQYAQFLENSAKNNAPGNLQLNKKGGKGNKGHKSPKLEKPRKIDKTNS